MENVKHERRKRATVRERRRMHQLNDAFDRLRSYIPTYPSSEKTSKIQTLKLAIEYIRDLADLLRDTEGRAVYAGEDICLLPRRTPVITSQGILRGNPDSWMDDVATESLQQSQLSDEVVVSLPSLSLFLFVRGVFGLGLSAVFVRVL